MRDLKKISMWILNGSYINSSIALIFYVLIDALYRGGIVGRSLDVVATTLFVYSLVLIGIAAFISSTIERKLRELRDSARRRKGGR